MGNFQVFITNKETQKQESRQKSQRHLRQFSQDNRMQRKF